MRKYCWFVDRNVGSWIGVDRSSGLWIGARSLFLSVLLCVDQSSFSLCVRLFCVSLLSFSLCCCAWRVTRK